MFISYLVATLNQIEQPPIQLMIQATGTWKPFTGCTLHAQCFQRSDLRIHTSRERGGPPNVFFCMLGLTQRSNYLTFKGSFSAVSKPYFANKYAVESSRRDLQNALSFAVFSKLNVFVWKCFCLKIAKHVAKVFPKLAKFVKILVEFVDFRAEFYRNFTKSCSINENYQMFAKKCEIKFLWNFVKFELDLS